jgi:hypothetical protein
MACMNEEQDDEAPFEVGHYVLVVNEPDAANVFGVVVKKKNRHQFIIRDADGQEITGKDDWMLHATPGDTSWSIWLIPAGGCLVNIEPDDMYYTSEPDKHVDFDALATKLASALGEQFAGTDFSVVPVMKPGEPGIRSIHNNSPIADAAIEASVTEFLERVPGMEDIWLADDEDDDEPAAFDDVLDYIANHLENHPSQLAFLHFHDPGEAEGIPFDLEVVDGRSTLTVVGDFLVIKKAMGFPGEREATRRRPAIYRLANLINIKFTERDRMVDSLVPDDDAED